MKNAIYIGKGFRRKFKNKVWIDGIGFIDYSELNFGRTGTAFYDDGKWDFRPDGLNISHLVNRKDLSFNEYDRI